MIAPGSQLGPGSLSEEVLEANVVAHRHLHAWGEIPLSYGKRISSLACTGQLGTGGVVDTESLEWQWLKDVR